ncbi:MAG: alkaline phosphatase family protein [Oscillospiraceae bacterium]|jgi:phosphonoacetate hydrolase
MKKYMILVIDGCAPEYLTEQTAPGLFRLARKYGFIKTVSGAMPSVTNVNHACILSGRWPEDTGVVGNYYYRPETGEEGFIEERGYMKAPTLLQRCRDAGGTTALFTVKGKVLGVYGDGADIGLSEQNPDPELLRRYGLPMPPPIQSVDSTRWILDAAYRCMKTDDPDLVYCTTNDYIFHHFAPGQAEANEQIAAVDEYIQKIHALNPERQIYITADHGMNQKTTIVNFPLSAARAGFSVYCLPPLKDRYIENHIYQEGGALYVFLSDQSQAADFYAFAKAHPHVEQVLTREQAAAAYHLPAGQIGDYMLFSKPGSAFGEVEGETLLTTASRTHGSLYEQTVPLIAINPELTEQHYSYHKDVAAILMERL